MEPRTQPCLDGITAPGSAKGTGPGSGKKDASSSDEILNKSRTATIRAIGALDAARANYLPTPSKAPTTTTQTTPRDTNIARVLRTAAECRPSLNLKIS